MKAKVGGSEKLYHVTACSVRAHQLSEKLTSSLHIAEKHHKSVLTLQSWVAFARRYVLCEIFFPDWNFNKISKTVKKSAKVIIERYYPKLTLDFETNKRICDEIATIASKRLRNKVCFNCQAYDTHKLASVTTFLMAYLVTDCRLYYSFDETYPKGSRPWHIVQTTRRRARAQGSICARDFRPGLHAEFGEWPAGC